jgi:hypothetical protein
MIYNFPVENMFHAREVTDLDFDIKNRDLYVNLDNVRITDVDNDYCENLKFSLNINPKSGKLETPTNDYVKVLFSGHRGTGKTLELRKFQNKINHPDRYFSVFIELENELEIAKFKPEDYFILLILKIAREIDSQNLKIKTKELDSIINDWLSEKEIVEEVKENTTFSTTAEAGAGINLLEFVKLKLNIKSVFASETKTSEIIRTKFRKNTLEFVSRFNLALSEIRQEIKKLNKGNDILFIIDGSEKIPLSVYKQLFVDDSYILRGINANIISSVRIDAFYDVTTVQQRDFFLPVLVPMIKITGKSKKRLSEVITKRIKNDVFFEDKVLNFFVEMSGGCIRQLLKIVNRAILYTRGRKIDMKTAKKTAKILAGEMSQTLTSEHKTILRKAKWKDADEEIAVADENIALLIYSLILLKYNGIIEINPLIKDMFKKPVLISDTNTSS